MAPTTTARKRTTKASAAEKPAEPAATELQEVEWLDELPPRTSKRSGKYDWFFDQLRANPGVWAAWPGNSSATAQIKAGNFAGIEAGEFEATSRAGKVFARYVGEG